MDTNNNQVKGSAAKDQFEDLMGGGLEFETDSNPPVADTLDLTAMDEITPESSPTDMEDVLSMEDSLEKDNDQVPSTPGGQNSEIEEVGTAESLPAAGDDLVRQTTDTDDDIEAIQDFKAAVLAFEWEINDENMNTFNREVTRFKKRWQNNKLLLVFMQILEALGKYIAVAKAKAHPDSIKLLLSVYNSLEKIVTSQRLTPRGQKKLLLAEVDKYNNLKLMLKEPVHRQKKSGKKPPPAGAAAMMAGHGQVNGDEITVERTEQEDFPELDARLDSFFDDETLPADDNQQEFVPPVVPPHPEDDSCAAVDNLLDDMFSDVINKGDGTPRFSEDEDVVSLGLGNDDELEGEEGLIVGEELSEADDNFSPLMGADSESLELELSGEDAAWNENELGLNNAALMEDSELEDEKETLPDMFLNVFRELEAEEKITDELAARLLAESLNLQQEWHDRPLLLTIITFLCSLARETAQGNEMFREKSRKMMLEIYRDLEQAVNSNATERQLLVNATAQKYLVWKEETFPVDVFTKTEGEVESTIDKKIPEQQDNEEKDGNVTLLEPGTEVDDPGEQPAASEDEQQSGLLEENITETKDVSKEVTEGDQLFDAPEQDTFPDESPEKPGIWEKLKNLFRPRPD